MIPAGASGTGQGSKTLELQVQTPRTCGGLSKDSAENPQGSQHRHQEDSHEDSGLLVKEILVVAGARYSSVDALGPPGSSSQQRMHS